jgi:hypothetical protein
MPLVRGRIIGYDANRMSFEFTMIDKALVAIIECEISGAALDQLAGSKGTMPDEREAQFLHLRDAIERLASDLFDKGTPTPDETIRIFYHHVR